VNEFGFSAEMLSEQQAKPAVESPVATAATVNGHPISIREVETTKSAASTDAALSEPAAAAADSEDGVKTGAWKSQKQKSKKAKKID
jgi:hypothetical protein